MRSTMRRASSVPSPPRGVDTAGMAGLVGSVNDATHWQQAACDDTKVDVVRFLSQLPEHQHENPAADDNSAIRWAARNGRCDVVRYLCELPGDRGVNPAACDNSAIQWASEHGHVDVVRYLCELPADRGVDPAARNNFPIVEAAWSGRVQVVRYLCKQRGVDPWAGMIEAVKCGQLHVLRYLCEQYLPGHHDLPAVPSAVNRDVKPGGDIGPLRYRYPVNGHRRADTLFRIADVRCIRRYVENAYPTAVPTNCRSHATLRSAARRPLLVLRTLLASSRATCLAARAKHDDLHVMSLEESWGTAGHAPHPRIAPSRPADVRECKVFHPIQPKVM